MFRLLQWCSAVTLLAGIQVATVDQRSTPPRGLSPSDWADIRAAYEASRHAVFSCDGGYQARNPGQQWRTHFDRRGFLVTPDGGGWSWGLELVSFGRAGDERVVQSPGCIDADGPRVSYGWAEALTEWYVNDPRGLEHGYTVHHRPERALASPGRAHDRCQSLQALEGISPLSFLTARRANGASAARSPSRDLLHLTLAIRGDLHPRILPDGRSVAFVNASGAVVVNYFGLTVFDADGRSLPAHFEPRGDGLRLAIDDRAARYPLTVDPIAQQAYLKASNTDIDDQFGSSIAISGNTLVVGAPGEASNATGVNGDQYNNSAANSGAAYVFVRSGTTWTQQAYLKASNAEAGDLFGYSVAISGDTAVVSARSEDSSATGVNGNQADNGAAFSGAAYVFVRSGTTWSQQAYLKASNAGTGDLFGYSVAISANTVVVGARQEASNATGVNGNQADNSAPNAGAAYVFTRNGTTWSQEAYLKASNTGANDFFGAFIALSDVTVLVGAHSEDSNATGVNGNQANNSASNSGAAYVFVRGGTTWSQQAYLKASNTGAGDGFGLSVGISGDTAVVGAWLEDSNATGVSGNQADNSAADSGAAYVFVRSGTSWSQQAYLKASNTGAGDWFGSSIAVGGDTLLAGAYHEGSNATGVNGNGADDSAGNSGAAYVFVRSGANWGQQAYLKASNTDTGDLFGLSVAISGDTAVVGVPLEDSIATGVNGNQADNSAANSGAAYVFTGVCVPGARGDANCDGGVDFFDIDPFIVALFDFPTYQASFCDGSLCAVDANCSAAVDFFDIDPFLACLFATCPACP